MRFRLCLAALVVCSGVFAQDSLTVSQVVQFVKSSIQLKQPDKEVAQYIAKLKLSQRLDDRTIEDLQGAGAGPKTVAALHGLRDATESLPKPAPVVAAPAPPPIPPPSYEEQQRVLNEVREYALNYSKTLPDFICSQVTRRFYDPTGAESWRSEDTYLAKLTYFEQREKYQLMLVNNQMTNRAYDSLGGATSSGEFGSMLKQIFDPETHAEFHWDHWARLRGHRAHVYRYSVEQGNSRWMVDYEHREQIMPAYEGLIYVDSASNRVLAVTLRAIEIPPGFPIQDARTRLDYDFTKIGDREFLLPMRAEIRMRHDHLLTKNDVEFRMYRKFSADTTLTFETDTPAPISDDKTKEEPPK